MFINGLWVVMALLPASAWSASTSRSGKPTVPKVQQLQKTENPNEYGQGQSHLPNDAQVPEQAPVGPNTNISLPDSAKLKFVVRGEGVQNYTCQRKNGQSHWVSIGAVATLEVVQKHHNVRRDVGGLPLKEKKSPKNHGNGNLAELNATPADSNTNPEKTVSKTQEGHVNGEIGDQQQAGGRGEIPTGSGNHYFVKNGQGLIAPKFDFHETGFLIGQVTGLIKSPEQAKENVPWLRLKAIEGELATYVLRTTTRGGVAPPGACQASEKTLSVKYKALYWFYDDERKN